ncbi:hypothetical protein AVEN_260362-1 [Araneus ventricosus]|uniref:Uncharacterized protein n=1 Tax=Araneus ventricosus TaxID=182803 RepID=A0A4Y2WNB1_ARAVE|nr:hypothetical protein AVEN_260362-1 [Araneus ventricosus]
MCVRTSISGPKMQRNHSIDIFNHVLDVDVRSFGGRAATYSVRCSAIPQTYPIDSETPTIFFEFRTCVSGSTRILDNSTFKQPVIEFRDIY